jgi:hypothetical protein
MGEERRFRPCCPNPFGCIGEDGCCSQPFTTPFSIEYSTSKIRDCSWNKCGFQDPNGEPCDKTYYQTETNVFTYQNGSVETTIRNRSLNEDGICITTRDIDCDSFNNLGCSGIGTGVTTYSNPVENPVCLDLEGGYAPYRYQGPNFTYWQDPCFTQPYPTHNSDGTFSEEDYPSAWAFTTQSVNFDLTSNICSFGFNEQSIQSNVRYRVGHHTQATCYLKIWLRVSTQKLKPVQSPDPFQPCCFNLVADGEPTREYVIYEWVGSGRPCFDESAVKQEDGTYDFQSCESVIYSPEYELVSGENEVKTVSIHKWSFIPDYEPNEFVDGEQGNKPNGFPQWPYFE